MLAWLFLLAVQPARGRDIRTVHLNKNFHMKSLVKSPKASNVGSCFMLSVQVPNDSPDIECLAAPGEIFIPKQLRGDRDIDVAGHGDDGINTSRLRINVGNFH